jgi:imidazole glycerol phosphate synthase subunit HisF
VHIPVIASGGAGAVQHFVDVFEKTNVDAALGSFGISLWRDTDTRFESCAKK